HCRYAKRDHSRQDRHDDGIADPIASLVGIVDGADETDSVDEAIDTHERSDRAVDRLLQRLHEHLQGEVVPVYLPINAGVAIDDRRLGGMQESAGLRRISESQIACQLRYGVGIAAEKVPVGKIDAL